MAATERSPAAPAEGQSPPSGDEPITADLATSGPRITTPVLVAAVLVLVVLLATSLVVAFVVVHQPRLTPVPVPSVSSIA